jgi:hypothetical protein
LQVGHLLQSLEDPLPFLFLFIIGCDILLFLLLAVYLASALPSLALLV